MKQTQGARVSAQAIPASVRPCRRQALGNRAPAERAQGAGAGRQPRRLVADHPRVHAGAWQANVNVTLEDSLRYWAVFRCISIIASDIAKMRLKLVEQDANGIWAETRAAAFSPVLRKPNPMQTRIQFIRELDDESSSPAATPTCSRGATRAAS